MLILYLGECLEVIFLGICFISLGNQRWGKRAKVQKVVINGPLFQYIYKENLVLRVSIALL